MSTTEKKNIVDRKYIDKAIDYSTYRNLIDVLLIDHKVTGPNQSEALVNYTKLNVQRMQRIDKTVKLLPEVQEFISTIGQPQTWLVITEGWCGDAAQILPVLNAMAKLNPLIALRFVFRDENIELMDQYLTGTSRSIPKLIVLNASTNEEIFSWGPRPSVLQTDYLRMKKEGVDGQTVVEKIHGWYAKDKTVTTQLEILQLLKGQ